VFCAPVFRPSSRSPDWPSKWSYSWGIGGSTSSNQTYAELAWLESFGVNAVCFGRRQHVKAGRCFRGDVAVIRYSTNKARLHRPRRSIFRLGTFRLLFTGPPLGWSGRIVRSAMVRTVVRKAQHRPVSFCDFSLLRRSWWGLGGCGAAWPVWGDPIR
jgi:hypothetical protein